MRNIIQSWLKPNIRDQTNFSFGYGNALGWLNWKSEQNSFYHDNLENRERPATHDLGIKTSIN